VDGGYWAAVHSENAMLGVGDGLQGLTATTVMRQREANRRPSPSWFQVRPLQRPPDTYSGKQAFSPSAVEKFTHQTARRLMLAVALVMKSDQEARI
jgi:hypothetical protein